MYGFLWFAGASALNYDELDRPSDPLKGSNMCDYLSPLITASNSDLQRPRPSHDPAVWSAHSARPQFRLDPYTQHGPSHSSLSLLDELDRPFHHNCTYFSHLYMIKL